MYHQTMLDQARRGSICSDVKHDNEYWHDTIADRLDKEDVGDAIVRDILTSSRSESFSLRCSNITSPFTSITVYQENLEENVCYNSVFVLLNNKKCFPNNFAGFIKYFVQNNSKETRDSSVIQSSPGQIASSHEGLQGTALHSAQKHCSYYS